MCGVRQLAPAIALWTRITVVVDGHTQSCGLRSNRPYMHQSVTRIKLTQEGPYFLRAVSNYWVEFVSGSRFAIRHEASWIGIGGGCSPRAFPSCILCPLVVKAQLTQRSEIEARRVRLNTATRSVAHENKGVVDGHGHGDAAHVFRGRSLSDAGSP